jgi:hypothetical protein
MKTASFFSAITPDFQSDEDPIHPLDIIIDAWNQTCRERVTGSSTICVATLDNKLNQLSYSNLGDCGLVVMRHIDSETVGYMRERTTPRHLRKHDLRVAYLSQQQLRSFNLPYQLGFSGIPQHLGSFETPLDADTGTSINPYTCLVFPVLPYLPVVVHSFLVNIHSTHFCSFSFFLPSSVYSFLYFYHYLPLSSLPFPTFYPLPSHLYILSITCHLLPLRSVHLGHAR